MQDDSNDAPSPDDDFKWRLISVLFSTQPLSSSLARILFDAAWDLYRTDTGSAKINAPLVQGKIDNLRRDMMLGTVGGPAFEATIDTERGTGTVRFLITRQGLEFMAEQLPASQQN
ncbi:MAG: hypothetical protein U0269_10075 [Polyangiales bacterium]